MSRAVVLERFGEPLSVREFPVTEPPAGGMAVACRYGGICGIDLHPRLGHPARTDAPRPGTRGLRLVTTYPLADHARAMAAVATAWTTADVAVAQKCEKPRSLERSRTGKISRVCWHGGRTAEGQRVVERSRLAYRATKHKKAVLRSGGEGTAVVRFLADGGRANEFRQLVYLELEVSRPGREPYVVKTGEYLTAASAGSVAPGRVLHVKVDELDPERVAVDWERSLRLVD